jgi:hypothetical protein
MIFRVFYYPAGAAHVRCTLFVALPGNHTYASCGQFTLRRGAEFTALLHAFTGAEFVSGDDDPFAITHACEEPAGPVEAATEESRQMA